MAKRKAAETPSSIGTFEESLTELQAIVADMEDGSLGLESSLARFERGVGLLRACYVILDSAEQQIEVLAQGDAAATSPNEPATPAGATRQIALVRDDDRDERAGSFDKRREVAVEIAGDTNETKRVIVEEPSLF